MARPEKRWQLLLVADDGRIVPFRRIKGIAVTLAVLIVILALVCAGLGWKLTAEKVRHGNTREQLVDANRQVRLDAAAPISNAQINPVRIRSHSTTPGRMIKAPASEEQQKRFDRQGEKAAERSKVLSAKVSEMRKAKKLLDGRNEARCL